MRLRKLELKDASEMLAWMHDDSVVHYMGTDFSKKNLEDCKAFITKSQNTEMDLHMAIVNEDDVYMGTVSLKHIDKKNQCAEFAITVRKEAMGKGYSKFGMYEILKIGLEEMGLEQIYWYVSKQNVRAIKFYDKNGYNRIQDIPQAAKKYYADNQKEEFIWYMVIKNWTKGVSA